MSKKTIVVVGASRGIGKALVNQFAQDENHHVIALARNQVRMQEDFGHLPNVTSYAFDLANDCRAQVEQLFQVIPQVDILINNAGYLVNKPLNEITHQDLTLSYQVNVIGVIQTVQALVPKMLQGAHVVNISSMGGFQGTVKFAGLTAYSTSKAALVSFTELFAEEFKDTAIKMNCLCLGAVQTEMLEEAFPGYQALISPAQMAEYIVNFAYTAQQWMHGRIVPVSLTTP